MSWRTIGGRLNGRGRGEQSPITEKRVFDGAQYTSFCLTEDFEGSRFPQAVLVPGRRKFVTDETLFPILLNLRPLDPDLKRIFDIAAFELTEETTTIAGRQCLQLVSEKGGLLTGKRVIWVAPDADFSIVRYTFLKPDLQSVLLETTIVVEQSPQGVYVPAKWSTEKPGDWESEIVVDKLEINPKIDDAEFSIVFPTNTLVIDERAHETKTSIVRADGSLFPVTRSRTYKEALEKANSQKN